MSATGCPFSSHSAEKTDVKAPSVNVTEQQESLTEEQKCLYDRLGGYDVVSEFAGFLLKRCIESPELGHFWNTMSEDSFHHELSNFTDFCSVKWGCTSAMYKGRDMHTTHRGMGITEEHWQGLLRITYDACAEKNLSPELTQEFIDFLEKYKSAVICGPSFKDCVLNNPDMDVRKKMSAYGVNKHTVFPKN
ncbi:CYFA0S12e01237g1_1 [Cyberlindnera fabianii]|uniref:CYFA0S12e01237g1_1 n=1 Tax=Cyberlindnera fabianii TaxID=36022 RepID=A0A061B0Y7_CYBFA|nr:Group 1 hemoglobin [Cyberlindnera fabianii]CDR43535.1 CYFA0S12e01237g1_1 [Cyberlindnera fabianii]